MENNRYSDIGMKFSSKKYEWRLLRKITYQNSNQHITMRPCIKFQSIWRTNLPKFAQNYMNDKILKNQTLIS